MELRDFLKQREHELLNDLDALRGQIEALQTKLIPLEAELAEVRRAMNAVGMGGMGIIGVPITSPPSGGIGLGQTGIGSLFSTPLPPGLTVESFFHPGVQDTLPSPYAHMTMKELVVKALSEHFHHGATTRQLLDFFRDAWGRNIERTNLSPQLSRLYHEGTIGRVQGLKEWYLVPENRRGKRPYRVMATAVHSNARVPVGDIEWLSPNEATEHHELIVTGPPVPDPDPDED